MSPVDVVRDYNNLAARIPEEAWSRKFAHSRMEYSPGNNSVTLHYGTWYDPERCYVFQKIRVALDKVSEEFSRLKARACYS